MCKLCIRDRVDAVLDCIATDGRRNIDGQLDLFGLDEGESCGAVPVPDVEEYPKNELMQMARETTGLYLSGCLLYTAHS